MSKNALALVDCSNREKLFHFLINTFDRKSTKKEMISPYDDQLIGKMNFRYSGAEHAMFFTYARSSEYPGMKFRNHKIIYLSLDVNDISSDIFNHICTRFGGYVIYNDEMETGWTKIDRQQPDNDDDLSLSADIVAERHFLFDTDEEGNERKVYRELKLEPDVEEEAEEREWAPPVTEVKEHRQDKKQGNGRGGRTARGSRQDDAEQRDKQEKEKQERQNRHERTEKQEKQNRQEKTNKQERAEKHEKQEKSERNNKQEKQDKQEKQEKQDYQKPVEQKDTPKITVKETLRSHERQREMKENREIRKAQKAEQQAEVKDSSKNSKKDYQKQNYRRGQRGGRRPSGKPNGQPDGAKDKAASEKPQNPKTDA